MSKPVQKMTLEQTYELIADCEDDIVPAKRLSREWHASVLRRMESLEKIAHRKEREREKLVAAQ